ncbi:MAG: AmmeMemoRadiSam system radical SAM enzyme [Candidatus Hatepunaea meridiana]|nr:AmmeMemoRadiSam system radical SAM enzyme [Candidatus Hatepunaea meridiana]
MEAASTKQPIIESAYQHKEGNRIRCSICPVNCKLKEGDIGICDGREVINGKLIATNYAQISSLHLDPMEKKPLYHFFPGSEILSVGPNGCNLSCPWCQNWEISQNKIPTRTVLPNDLADMVDALDGIGVAYTYAEPLIWYEYILDAGRILHERGLVNVFVTNGYINADPLKDLLTVADGFNIDLKSSESQCYIQQCGGKLEDVQRTIRMVYEAGKHLEITHLIITGLNDELNKIERVVDWIADIDKTIPLHLSRYFPHNKYKEPPTDLQFMTDAYYLAKSKLDWVYLGNTRSDIGQDSHCPECGSMLVKRTGYYTEIKKLDGDRCKNCGKQLNFSVDVTRYK